MLEILTLVLGPVSTNTYILCDSDSKEAVVIDPAWDGPVILAESQKRGWEIKQMWYTHAHFDHIGGAAALASALDPTPPIALHLKDFPLWELGGGGMLFGYQIKRGPKPNIDLAKVRMLQVGKHAFEVRHTPGHTPGHCIFYCEADEVLFSGDLIFQRSVGRTDLPGGNSSDLLTSIQTQVFTLPERTRILSGHGPETSVAEEKKYNPFVHDMV